MKRFEVAYVPIGVGTFHLESAQEQFRQSVGLLRKIEEQVVVPKEMLLTLDLLTAYLEELHPNLIVLQNVTFANAAYTAEIVKRFDCPILLWTLREPVIDGGRLRLNSLTGAYSAGNTIKQFKKGGFSYVYGGPSEEEVEEKVKACIVAARIKHEMRHLTLAAVGHTPQGFGFGRALDNEILSVFGVKLLSLEARELIEKAQAYSEEEVQEYLEDASGRMKGLLNTPKKNCVDFARLYKAYKEFVEENHVGALASRCWPDFFTAFGTPVCAVLAMLNDLGVAASCEAEVYGALSMYLGMKLSGKAVFFGDPVSLDEAENTVTFWHCGTAACSLAREDTGACVDVHCNRKIGPTLDFGCARAKKATVFRISKDEAGNFRFLLAKGEALDKPKQFLGTSSVVKLDRDAKEFVYETVTKGLEPHFVVVYDDVVETLKVLAQMLGLEVLEI